MHCAFTLSEHIEGSSLVALRDNLIVGLAHLCRALGHKLLHANVDAVVDA